MSYAWLRIQIRIRSGLIKILNLSKFDLCFQYLLTKDVIQYQFINYNDFFVEFYRSTFGEKYTLGRLKNY